MRKLLFILFFIIISNFPSLSHTSETLVIMKNCQAFDADSFSACADRVNRGEIDNIVVTRMIECPTAAPCSYTLAGISRPVTIIGGAMGVGFSRAPNERASFGLSIQKSPGPITIRNLLFDMGYSADHGQPGAIWTDPDCPKTRDCPEEAIAILGSSNVLVDQVTVKDAKRFGIAISNSSSIFVRRSIFTRTHLYGIWVAQAPASRGLHIEDNRFIDTRSNGVMVTGDTPEADDPFGVNTVTGNLFNHNHNAAVFHSCGPSGNGPCAGGQLVLEQQSGHFLIADNEFEHGVLDEDASLTSSLRVAGVEVAPVKVHDVTIQHNYFHDLTAGALSLDSIEVASEVRAIDNKFERVGARDPALAYADRLSENRGNCQATDHVCAWVHPTGKLNWKPCRLSGAEKCDAEIYWHSENTKEPLRILVDGRTSLPVSAMPMLLSIVKVPTRLDLYAGSTLLDTVEAKAAE